jgi:hypothetical protein
VNSPGEVTSFELPKDGNDFQRWIARKPTGFVLNELAARRCSSVDWHGLSEASATHSLAPQHPLGHTEWEYLLTVEGHFRGNVQLREDHR